MVKNRVTMVHQATLFVEHGGDQFPDSAPSLSDTLRSLAHLSIVVILFNAGVACIWLQGVAGAQETATWGARTLEQEKAAGALKSSYRTPAWRMLPEETPAQRPY